MDSQLQAAIELVFKELLADATSENSRIATAAHACIIPVLDWKGQRIAEEEYLQAEIERQRYRI